MFLLAVLSCIEIFYHNGRDRYQPTTFDLEIHLTRDANNLIFLLATKAGQDQASGAATSAQY